MPPDAGTHYRLWPSAILKPVLPHPARRQVYAGLSQDGGDRPGVSR